MSEFPYTDEQVEQFARAYFVDDPPIDDEIRLEDCRRMRGVLSRLHDAGIKVEFPEPLFIVTQRDHAGSVYWRVEFNGGHVKGTPPVAEFHNSVPQAKEEAHAYAERLNREFGHATRLNAEVSS